MRRWNVALLWFGGLISTAGGWVLLIGLPIYVYKVTGSTLATGTMFLSGLLPTLLLPTLLLGSMVGVFVERWDRRRTLIIVDVLFAFGLLPLLPVHSTASIWIVYLVAFVESSLAQFAGPAVAALIPLLVDERQLPTVNSLLAVGNNIARVSGPLLGGVMVEALGLTGVALTDAASFLVAGLSIALIRVVSGRETEQTPAAAAPVRKSEAVVWRGWWEGLHRSMCREPVWCSRVSSCRRS